MLLTPEVLAALLSIQRRLAHEIDQPQPSRPALAEIEAELRLMLTKLGAPVFVPAIGEEITQ